MKSDLLPTLALPTLTHQSSLWLAILLLLLLTLLGQLVLIPRLSARRAVPFLTITTFLPFLALFFLLIQILAQFTGPWSLEWLTIDGTALISTSALALFAILATLAMAGQRAPLREAFPLLLCSFLGAMVAVSTTHLITLFVALELLSLSTITLIAAYNPLASRTEAAFKYLILGGAASACLLYGAALIFGQTRSLDLLTIAQLLVAQPHLAQAPLFLVGGTLVFAAMLFKLGAAPFQSWVPDVYQGASLPVMGYMASLVKYVAFILLVRFVSAFSPNIFGGHIILIVAVLTMIMGNLMALVQTQIKRLLAYSAIAHSGLLLLALLVPAHQLTSPASLGFLYLLIYGISILGLTTLLTQLTPQPRALTDLHGLFYRHPGVAIWLSLFLFSLAGLPPTAGFIAKFYLLLGVMSHISIWVLLFVLAMMVVALWYYLRIVISLFARSATPEPRALEWQPRLASHLTVLVTATFLILWGLWPRSWLIVAQWLAQ